MKKSLLIMICMFFVIQAKEMKFNVSLAPALGITKDSDKSPITVPHIKTDSKLFGIIMSAGVVINEKHHFKAIGIKTFDQYRTIAGGGAGYEISLVNHDLIDFRLGAYVGVWHLNELIGYTEDRYSTGEIKKFYAAIPVTFEIGSNVPRFFVSSKLLAGESVAGTVEAGLSLVFGKKN